MLELKQIKEGLKETPEAVVYVNYLNDLQNAKDKNGGLKM